MAQLSVPQSLRSALAAHPVQLADGQTLADAMAALNGQQPEVFRLLWREDKFVPGFFVFINQRLLDATDIGLVKLLAGDQVRIVQPLAGG